MPLLQKGYDAAAMDEASNELSPALARVSDEAILAVYHGQQSNSWIRNILEGFEAALTSAGLHSRLERFPAMCFLRSDRLHPADRRARGRSRRRSRQKSCQPRAEELGAIRRQGRQMSRRRRHVPLS